MSAETEPVAQVDPTIGLEPILRWEVRARSISECVARLSEVWRSAAAQAETTPELADEAAGWAMGDPRLARHLTEHRSVRVRMRTSVLTLVVVAPRPETAERALAAISNLKERHPSRAIVISPTDLDGPSKTDAHIHAECRLSQRAGSEICTEQVLIKVGGELAQHLSRVVAPLLIHDLPVVLWWPDDPPFGTRQFDEVAAAADRLLVDSGTFHEDDATRLAGLAALVADGVDVTDIGWLRMSLWRELLAGLFDHPLLTRELEHIRSVRVDVARPSTTMRFSRAAFYLGWLAARLGWETARPLAPRGGDPDELHGAFRAGRREIPVEIHPVRATLDSPHRAAGSLVRVDIEAARPKAIVRARVTRQADHLLATADWNGAPVARRAGQLDPFDETPFVSDALERPGLDRTFQQSLIRAVRLLTGG